MPLVEVKISAVPFHFSALEVDSLGAGIFLGGVQCLREVAVYDHSPAVNAAKEEVACGLVLCKFGLTKRLVDRHPAGTFEVNLAPVVQVPLVRVHHKTALEMARNAFRPTKRKEKQGYLTAVAVPVVDNIFRNIGNGAVFAG